MAAGRRSKLTDKQWAEIGRRLAKGESTRTLGKEFGVGGSTISERFSGRTEIIKSLAKKAVNLEKEIEKLPPAEQCSVWNLADDMKKISNNLIRASIAGAETAVILQEKGRKLAKNLADEDVDVDDLRPAVACLEAANIAAKIPIQLLTANKTTPAEVQPAAYQIITGVPHAD